MPGLERRNYYLAPKGVPTEELLKHTHAAAAPDDVRFLNHDYQLFQIENAPKQVDGETGKKSRTAAPKPALVLSMKKSAASFAPSFAEILPMRKSWWRLTTARIGATSSRRIPTGKIRAGGEAVSC